MIYRSNPSFNGILPLGVTISYNDFFVKGIFTFWRFGGD